MQKLGIGKHRRIWLSVLVLFVFVAVSIFILASRISGFLLDDSNAIPLISESNLITSGEDSSEKENTQPSHTESKTSASATTQQATQPNKKPDFEAGDEQKVWSTDTKVEIFRVSYVNGEQVITVNSDNGDKLIAPGTENSYTFKLKNNGDAALDYTVKVDAYFTPGDIKIPITARINRYDGKWIAGNEEKYVNVSELDTAEDKETLGAGKYTYYTLDWIWPFESGNDELDTTLGNLATEQDLVFTVVITTEAAESSDPNINRGLILPHAGGTHTGGPHTGDPHTGDDSSLILWVILAIVSFVLIFYPLIGKRRSDAEAKKH